jgi:hypothetical protein
VCTATYPSFGRTGKWVRGARPVISPPEVRRAPRTSRGVPPVPGLLRCSQAWACCAATPQHDRSRTRRRDECTSFVCAPAGRRASPGDHLSRKGRPRRVTNVAHAVTPARPDRFPKQICSTNKLGVRSVWCGMGVPSVKRLAPHVLHPGAVISSRAAGPFGMRCDGIEWRLTSDLAVSEHRRSTQTKARGS